ncbi:hypothetical protein NRI_0672 [Neorickettsia risticii str. Illinois]|uniref:Uncharacterized protein n=1 Tax=Neorickettsia risticii (strain Illinois) TaxID=434131 RepID=C6V5I0_NEORI|nr:hypothetical protein NRI_0672 [Neorickettsia risticii str. Illinois]
MKYNWRNTGGRRVHRNKECQATAVEKEEGVPAEGLEPPTY